MLDSLSSPPKKYLFNYLFLLPKADLMESLFPLPKADICSFVVHNSEGRHLLDSLSTILKADLYLISCPHYSKQNFAGFLFFITQSRLLQHSLSSIPKKDFLVYLFLIPKADLIDSLFPYPSADFCWNFCPHYLRETFARFLAHNSEGRPVPDILSSVTKADFC